MSVKVGIIGCGNLGRTHAECLASIEGAQLHAFCDVAEDKAQGLAATFGGYATPEVDRLLDDRDIGAIYVCTQHDSHADLCIRAAEAGKHVMVEKPLALTVPECTRVGETVERTGIKLMTAFKMRYYEMILKAKELIPEPLLVTMQMMDNRWPDHIWANDPVKGGGNAISQGCHACDILRFVAGRDPLEVYAVGGNYYTGTGVIDNLSAVFHFQGGLSGSWVQGDCNTPPLTSKFFMQLFAEGKSITLSDRLCTLTYSEQGKPPQVFRGVETGFLEENRAFIRCIQEDTPPPIDHVDGLYATLMPLQAFASIKSGKPEPIAALID